MASASSDPSASSSSDLLRNARFSAGPSAPEISAPSSAQLLHDAAALHPMANLGRADLDYLLLDDAKLNDIRGGSTVLPTRSWGDELCYGTGTTYLFGQFSSNICLRLKGNFAADGPLRRLGCWWTLGTEGRMGPFEKDTDDIQHNSR